MNKLTKAQQLIYTVIQNNPGVQNDEVSLIEAVYYHQGWDESKSLYWNLSRVMHPESISRRRRELYNMGLIEYSDKALKSRTDAYKNERNDHSGYEKKMADIIAIPRTPIEVTNDDGERVIRFA